MYIAWQEVPVPKVRRLTNEELSARAASVAMMTQTRLDSVQGECSAPRVPHADD